MVLETNDLWDENDPWASGLTWRVEEKRRWSEGIHQAVGLKKACNFWRRNFLKMFEMPVIEVPTNLPNIRIDLPIQAFATARGKWEYVREEVEDMFQLGQPILVGIISVENSEYLSELLKDRKIPHNVSTPDLKFVHINCVYSLIIPFLKGKVLFCGMRQRRQKLLPKQMLAKEILQDRLLPFMTEEAPNVEVDGEQVSQKGLSKIEIGPSSIALLAKAGCIAKYGRKSKEDWPYQKAKLLIQVSIEKGQSIDIDNLE
ncbi:putative protein translocase subunit SecA, SecA motor DEAD [Dioscorea sansibarensis]